MTEEKRKEITVRPAQPFEAVHVAKLVKEMLAEAKSPLAPPDDQRLVAWTNYVIGSEFCAVAEISGRIIGTTGFSAFQPPWSQERMMMLDWFYVIPAFRPRGTDHALLDVVERWAKSRKLRIYGCILNGTYADSFNARINNGGYHKAGLTFLKDFGDAE